MKKKSLIELLIAWLKARLMTIGLCILLMCIYLVVGKLAKLDFSAIWYSTYVFLFMALVFSLLDFRKYVKKYESLLTTYSYRNISVDQLPEANDLIEEAYQMIIVGIYEEMQATKGEMKRQRAEANDYYTLWAHQIKTPIAAMHLLLQDKEQTGSHFALEQELFKVEQYAQMALQYLRLESISSDLVLHTYELHDIITGALKKYAISFIGKKLSLEFEDFSVPVITDEKWLQFIIEQILSNCIKYTPNGKIMIRMKDPLTLEIADTGIGISNEDLPRIFQRGFTGYNGRMDKKSTGIGLYLCKKVADRLAHHIEVSSVIGKGTHFYISFDKNERTLQE